LSLPADLQTPCALVDLDAVERNTAAMSERVARLGSRLRPHVKTHKTLEAARLQVRGAFGGITVSTLAEARFFARAGFRDITYAVPIAPARMREAVELGRSIGRLSLLLDSEAAMRALESCSASQQVRAPVFLKIDCGNHRAGVDPTSHEARKLVADLAASKHLDFRGVLAHAGHAYACRDRDEIARVAREERNVTVGFAERLRAEGIRVEEVSIGSTPTMSLAEDLTGVTEVRPGNYVFFDAFQAAIGSCALADAAFTVLTTVISSYPDRRRLVIDAGALALSKDPGARYVDAQAGFGVLLTERGEPLAGLRLSGLSQEHGHIEAGPEADLSELPVGARLRVVANHSCLTAALFDRYLAVRGGELVGEWRPVRGW
jgi:D-serine deaminase-like pyridoxal phosphate-dependent protein